MRGKTILQTALLSVCAAGLALSGCGGGSATSSSGESGDFAPQATLTAVGGTGRGAKPEFVTRVKARPGDPNIKSVAVNLPPVVLIDGNQIGRLCNKVELKKDRCAGRKRLGFAEVDSPAFKGGLSGPVYAIGGYRPLPHLAYVLGGAAEILLEGKIVSRNERIQAGVEDVPDMPLEEFVLKIDGGQSGYLALTTNICAKEFEANARYVSQDGQVHVEAVPLQAECGS